MKRILLIITSLTLLLALIIYLDPILIAREIGKIELNILAFIVVLANLSILVRGLKWYTLLKDISLKEIIPIQLFSISVSNLTPGKIAEPIKSILLKMKKGIAVSETLPSVILERILDIFFLIILSIFGIITISRYLYSEFLLISLLIFILLLFLMILVLIKKSFGLKIFNIAKRFRFFSFLNESFVNNFYSSTKIKKRNIILSSILTLIAWLIDGFIFYFIAFSLDKNLTINISPLFFCSALAISIIASLVTFLPGGIGGTEALMTYLFVSIGFSKASAGATVLLGRFATLGYSMILGYLSFLYLTKKLKHIDIRKILENKN